MWGVDNKGSLYVLLYRDLRYDIIGVSLTGEIFKENSIKDSRKAGELLEISKIRVLHLTIYQ